MLSPENRIVLLPQDREIMDITGMSEEQYRWFVRECYKNAKLRPGEPVAVVIDPVTASILISIGMSLLSAAISYLLAPKPQDQEKPDYSESKIEGQDVVRKDRFAPKSGFDSFQNVVDMGSVIPIIYCKRHEDAGVTYGGLRVNTNLLWSQILSVGGGQFFRGIFLIGEGPVTLEPRQIALGNNTLSSYELVENAEAGRVTLYFTDDGGRIDSGDYELGVISANDPGAFDPNDIYEVDGDTKFCQALQPSNQVEFGIYGHIGNNFGYKIGEKFTAVTQWQNRADGEYERQNSNQKVAEMKKESIAFTTRCGFIGGTNNFDSPNITTRTVAVGDVLTYKIYRSSEYDRLFEENSSTQGGEEPSKINNHDVATSIASIQRGFDERINVGSLYKAGSAVVVCTSRTDPFISDVDYDTDGVDVTATFKVIQPGKVHEWADRTLQYDSANETSASAADMQYQVGKICSQYSQLFELLVASFSVERAFQTIEVGLHSNVGLKSSNITNFNSLVAEELKNASTQEDIDDDSYQAYVDAEFCGGDDVFPSQAKDEAYRKDIQAGRYSGADTRYSFFRILYRDIDNTSFDFTPSNNLYAIRSVTGVDVYNYLRFKFTQSKRREFRFMPISSWEIRSGEATGNLYAIDAHDTTELSVGENGFTIEFVGEQVTRSSDTFELKAFLNPNSNGVKLGRSVHDDAANKSYADGWARIAESFIYDSVSTTATEPEHKISYLNIISENATVPRYDDMALVGLNIRSSKELRALDQLSVYCEEGIKNSSGEAIHLFPDVFRDLLTNDRFGTGEFFNAAQIDTASFDAANTWTDERHYYFDGAISEKINLRSWGTERARDFLLDLSVSSGKFTLKPILRFGEAEPVAGMFSSGNIIEGSLQINYFDTQDRLDPIVSVRWREERRNSSVDSKGLFPQIREFNVRRAGVSENAPVIQVDLSNFCTNRRHAEDRAKLECQSKRYITHAVTFKTTPTQSGLQAGSVIKLAVETVTYNQPQNGAVTATGEVTSWPELADGTHRALIWDGTTLASRDLVVANGRAPGFENSVFSIEQATNRADTYKITKVSFDEDGNVDVEALYWPTNESGISLLTLDWNTAAEWDIDG